MLPHQQGFSLMEVLFSLMLLSLTAVFLLQQQQFNKQLVMTLLQQLMQRQEQEQVLEIDAQ